MPILHSSWQPATKKAEKATAAQTGPAKQIMADDTVIARTNREFQTDHPDNPSDQLPMVVGRSIEKNEQETKSPSRRKPKVLATPRRSGTTAANGQDRLLGI